MKLLQIKPEKGFRLLIGTERAQAATMVLPPGGSTGGPNNRHECSDQWLYVISGTGKAVVEGEKREFEEGALLLIEAGEAHEVSNTGESPLETLNIYSPPNY
ncbi:MAG: cupin domain-containing protein [Rubrobacteraceae bacterium]